MCFPTLRILHCRIVYECAHKYVTMRRHYLLNGVTFRRILNIFNMNPIKYQFDRTLSIYVFLLADTFTAVSIGADSCRETQCILTFIKSQACCAVQVSSRVRKVRRVCVRLKQRRNTFFKEMTRMRLRSPGNREPFWRLLFA